MLCVLVTLIPLSGQTQALRVSISPDGRYSIGQGGASGSALMAGVAAEVDGRWLHASEYPRHAVKQSNAQGYLGDADVWDMTFSGLTGAPDLSYTLRLYQQEPFADIQVSVENTTGRTIHVEAIRAVESSGGMIANLDGPEAQDRVLSDSFSEECPRAL